ncbi:synaptic vesicle glycoprotein 2A-like [Cydia strobilella]|uniref:synaptic vesicle glycoprotein 2A-like n=1 Tax=Cydia strobilella TaxID=1100964 RepID=UPI003006266D
MDNTRVSSRKCGFDAALELTGFGKYNMAMLSSCCLLILAMYLDIFGFSVILPAAACDLALSTSQQGLLSAVPLIGVMVSSYAWGLCADTRGRRWTLLLAMPIGAVLNLAASMAPGYRSLAILKFLSAGFTSSANAAAFVLVGETTPARHRSRFIFLMASATMLVQFIICVFAIPVFSLTFRYQISWLSLDYRPWRLLMQIISVPGIIGCLGMLVLLESPKFLLSKNQEQEAVEVLRSMHAWNTAGKTFPVDVVYMEECLQVEASSFFRRMWQQTAPLFKPPLLKNNLKLYYILLCAYMTSTGYTMWVPTMTNAYFNGDDSSGQAFCTVASKAALSSSSESTTDCDNVIQSLTLYAVMCYSGASGTLNVLLSFIVGPLGKKRTTLLVFVISALAGVTLLFVKIPLLSIALFYIFLYVALILGNVNTYLVELNPTYLRGMATCLSVVVARGFGFFSVQLIAQLLADYCTPMISGYVVLVASGLVVAFSLPTDVKKKDDKIIESPIEE